MSILKQINLKYGFIDSDSHVLEPPDLWHQYIDPMYRDRSPYVFRDFDGKEKFCFLDNKFGGQIGLSFLGSFGLAWGESKQLESYTDCQEGIYPHKRIEYMDREGIDISCLYPSLGLMMGGIQDPSFAAACYRAYNRWLSDFCSFNPHRLIGAAMIPMQSINLAISELSYVRNILGMKVIVLRPNPYGSTMLHDKNCQPFWEKVQDLDLTVAIHAGSAGDMPTVGFDRFKDNMMTAHIVSHTMEQMLAVLSIVFCGVADRFPRIRFGFFEGSGGWLPSWLDRMDRHYERVYSDIKLSDKPSSIFKRQCWIGFEAKEQTLSAAIEYLGVNNILWSTDYPHPDGVIKPDQLLRDNIALSNNVKNKILFENAARYYNLV